MEIEELNNGLKRGDKVRIAENVGCAVSTVKAVFSGERNPETELGKKIITAAEQIIDFHKTQKKELHV